MAEQEVVWLTEAITAAFNQVNLGPGIDLNFSGLSCVQYF